MHPQNALVVRLKFQPRAARRDIGGSVVSFAGAHVLDGIEIHARASDELTDDDALGAVDDERAVGGHERHVAHKHFLLGDKPGFLVDKTYLDFERNGVGGVAVLTLLLGVLRSHLEAVLQKPQLHFAAEVPDRRKILKDFADTGFQKLVVGVLLHLDEVRHLANLVYLRKRTSFRVSILDLPDSSDGHSFSP